MGAHRSIKHEIGSVCNDELPKHSLDTDPLHISLLHIKIKRVPHIPARVLLTHRRVSCVSHSNTAIHVRDAKAAARACETGTTGLGKRYSGERADDAHARHRGPAAALSYAGTGACPHAAARRIWGAGMCRKKRQCSCWCACCFLYTCLCMRKGQGLRVKMQSHDSHHVQYVTDARTLGLNGAVAQREVGVEGEQIVVQRVRRTRQGLFLITGAVGG
jgi:hypothetical protein